MKNSKSFNKNIKSVNHYLGLKLRGEPSELYSAAAHLIKNGGKRLRPHMVLQSCKILGGKSSDAMPAAGAIELIHNFTLVHDDIMDNDDMRHGVSTVHRKFGMPVAILAGDVLFSKAFQIISKTKLSPKQSIELISRLSTACVDICEGQLYDIKMAEGKKIPSFSQYLTMVEKKTAVLFDLACAMGAICADADKKDVVNLASFGKNLGIAFQITDDLIGVMGDPKITKKPVGNDLREGKKSLPILLAIKKATGKDKKIILKCFGNSRAVKKDLEKAVKIIQNLGIEKSVRTQALLHARKAKKCLDKYSGTSKKELVSLLEFVVERSL